MSPPSTRSTSKHRGPANRATRRAQQQIRPRGHHRRSTKWGQILTWLTAGGRERREREMFIAQMRELRLSAAALRAEVSVLRYEFELLTDSFAPEMSRLRRELEASTAELRSEMAGLRAEFELASAAARHEMSGLRDKLKHAVTLTAEREAEAEITILLPLARDYVGPIAPAPQPKQLVASAQGSAEDDASVKAAQPATDREIILSVRPLPGTRTVAVARERLTA